MHLSKQKIIKILLFEDIENDIILIKRELIKNGLRFTLDSADNLDRYCQLLQNHPDVILSENKIPSISAISALKLLKKSGLTIPFIVVSGMLSHETIHELTKEGLSDYLFKDRLDRLGLAIENALNIRTLIDEKNRIQNDLDQSEKRFRSIFKDNFAVMLIIDPENANIVDANLAAEKFYGWDHTELTSMKIHQINTKSQVDIKEIMRYAIEKSGFHFEFEHRISDGSVKDVEVFSSKMVIKEKEYLLSIIHDISARKAAEEAVNESMVHYRTLADSGNALIWTSDAEKKFDYFNKTWLDFTGRSLEEELGLGWSSGVHKDDRRRILDVYTGSFDDHIPFSIDFRLLKNNSEYRWIQVDGMPRFNARDEFIGFIGHCLDITEKKKQEELLKETEQKLREVLENSTNLFYSHNENNELLYLSPKVKHFFGIAKAEKMLWTDFLTSNPVNTEGKDYTERALKSGIRQPPYELELCKKNGEIIWVEVNETPVQRSDNSVIMVGALTDITKRKKAEDLLRKSENQYRNLFLSANDAILILDPVGETVLEVNPRACSLYGYTRNTFIGMDLKLINVNSTDLLEQLEHTFKNGTCVNYETIHKRSDSGFINVLINASVIEFDGLPAILSINHDITERKITEVKMSIFTRAIEQSPVSFILTDPEGNIEYVNPRFCELSGYNPDEVIGKHPGIFNSNANEETRLLEQRILKGEITNTVFSNHKKNGELFWVDAKIFPIHDDKGMLKHFVALQEDITEKKKILEELIAAKEKAEEANRLKSNFLSNMSHELRTPLIGILGYTELLHIELEKDEQKKIAGIVHQSGKRLLQTLNQILDLSRIEANKLELENKPVLLSNLLNGVYTLFFKTVNYPTVEFLLQDQTGGLVINTDARILESILNNLLNNAIKFTNKGHIILCCSKTVQDGKSYVNFSVIDSGIGIPEENRNIIFEEFRQVSEGYSRGFDGTGLGLTLAKKFTNLLNGAISFESIPGEGSTFSVIIPVEEVTENLDANISSAPSLSTANNIKVLVIDDNEISRNIVSLMLDKNYDVDSAEDEQIAYHKLTSGKYDFIFLDIALKQNVNGIQVMHNIRKMAEYKNTPIVAFTAYALKEEKENFLREGFNDFLAKPFTKKDLVEIFLRNPITQAG